MTKKEASPDSIKLSFDAMLERLGLEGWHTQWVPNPRSVKRGQVLPESKLIILFDVNLEDARETLLHEILEIKFRPMLQPYRTLVNAFVEWAEKQIYQAKENTIDDLIPLLIEIENSASFKHRKDNKKSGLDNDS